MLDVVKESHCMTMTFAILLGLIFVIELGAGISAYMLRTRVHGIVETNMEKGLLNYKVEGSEGVTQTWDIIQHEVKHKKQHCRSRLAYIRSQCKVCDKSVRKVDEMWTFLRSRFCQLTKMN